MADDAVVIRAGLLNAALNPRSFIVDSAPLYVHRMPAPITKTVPRAIEISDWAYQNLRGTVLLDTDLDNSGGVIVVSFWRKDDYAHFLLKWAG